MILNKSYPKPKVLLNCWRKGKIKKKERGKKSFKVLNIQIRKLSLSPITQRLDYSPFKYKRYQF